MLIAGFSELLIIISLIWVTIHQPFSKHYQFRAILLMCLITTIVAASLGAIKYLMPVNIQEAHSVMTYASKHLAMPFICLLTLYHINKTFTQSRAIHLSVLILTVFSLLSFTLNLWYALSFITDAAIIGSLIIATYASRHSAHIMRYLSFGIACLTSTILWGQVIQDDNLRIGAFHSVVALFFFFLGLTYQTIKSVKISEQK
jgi:hypothetical protein